MRGCVWVWGVLTCTARLASVARVSIRAITFDFGGTLDAEGVHWFDRFARLYAEADLTVGEARLREAFGHATRTGYAQPEPASVGLLDLVTFHVRAQWQFLGWAWSDRAHALAARCVAEARSNLERSRHLLAELRPHVRLGVISNFYGNLQRVLDEAGIGPLVDVALDSALAGTRKPERAIFARAAAALALPPAQILHVGDSLEQDVRAARNAGWQSAWLVGTKSVSLAEQAEADWVLRSLDELRCLVAETAHTAKGSHRTAAVRR